MEAKSTDRKTFQLTENGQQLGELVYENILFLNAEIRLPSSEVYKIEPVGLFQTSIKVAKDGAETAKLVMSWSGEIVITFQEGQEYVLKSKGIFNNKFIIENHERQHLIQFDPEFNWIDTPTSKECGILGLPRYCDCIPPKLNGLPDRLISYIDCCVHIPVEGMTVGTRPFPVR